MYCFCYILVLSGSASFNTIHCHPISLFPSGVVLSVYCAFILSELWLVYCACVYSFYNPQFLDIDVQSIIKAKHTADFKMLIETGFN